MDFDSPLFRMMRETQERIDRSISPSMRALAGVSELSKRYDETLFRTANHTRAIDISNTSISRIIRDITNSPSQFDIQRKAVLDVIAGNSISALSRYDWKRDFPDYFTRIENNQINRAFDEGSNWESKFNKLNTFNSNFQKLATSRGVEMNTLPDAFAVALNIELEDNNSNENTSKIIEETNQLIIDIRNIDFNDKLLFYEIYDRFIIKIGEIVGSKRFNEIFNGLLVGVFLLIIQQEYFTTPSEVDNFTYIDKSTHSVKQITNNFFLSQSEIENGKIYCSSLNKDLKASRDNRSKTILNIAIGTKIKVLKKYRTWLWVRVLDGNEFPDGFIKNSDLYSNVSQ